MAPPAMTRRRLGIGGDVARWHPLRQWVLLAAVVGDDGDIRAAPFGRGDKVVGAAGPFVDAAENMVGTAHLMLRRIAGADGAGVIPVEHPLPRRVRHERRDPDAAIAGVVARRFGKARARIDGEGLGQAVRPNRAILDRKSAGGTILTDRKSTRLNSSH